jgi:hypothetical protein
MRESGEALSCQVFILIYQQGVMYFKGLGTEVDYEKGDHSLQLISSKPFSVLCVSECSAVG